MLELFACCICNQLQWLVDRNLQLAAVGVLSCNRRNLAFCEWVDVQENSDLVENGDDAFVRF